MGQGKSKPLKFPQYPQPPGYPQYYPYAPQQPPVGYAPGYHQPVFPPGYGMMMPQPQVSQMPQYPAWGPPQHRPSKKKKKRASAPPAPALAQPVNQPTVVAPAPTNVQPAPAGMLDNLPPGFVPTSITPNPPGASGSGPVIPPIVPGNSNAQGAVPPPLFTPGVPGNAQLTDLPSSAPPPTLRRAATPFHAAQPQNESDEGDEDDDEHDLGRSHSRSHRRAASQPHHLQQLPPITADDPIASPGVRPNPLPAPPRDLFQLSPYKHLLHLSNTTSLLNQTRTANQGPVFSQSNANLTRSSTNPGMAGIGAGVNAMQPQTAKKKKKFFSFRRSRDPTSQSAPPPPPLQHQLSSVPFMPIYQSAPYGQTPSGPARAPGSGLTQPQPQAGPSGDGGVRPHAETPVPPVPTPPSPPPQRSPPPDDDEGSDDGVLPPDVYRSISSATGNQSNFGSQQPQFQQPVYPTQSTQPVIPNQPSSQVPPAPPPSQPQSYPQSYPQFSQTSTSIQNPYLVSPGGTTMEFSHTSLPDFLNHSHHRVMYENRTYPSAMHLHEAMKFMETKPELAEKIRNTPNVEDVYPLTARLQVWVRPDWSTVFLEKMEEVLLYKFLQHPDLRMMLMKTGNARIVYSDPADPYWGSGARYGAGSAFPGTNYLGKLLESVREQLKGHGYTAMA